jgi:Sec-independent protein translocase protein TatA
MSGIGWRELVIVIVVAVVIVGMVTLRSRGS